MILLYVLASIGAYVVISIVIGIICSIHEYVSNGYRVYFPSDILFGFVWPLFIFVPIVLLLMGIDKLITWWKGPKE